ncbi:unnamed protein product [Allacma fusca]|uniref:Integrin alpha-2 domain-containing protein n=1 Tax=Allacma fusca TaxID=39272 RepID=A0A8J2L660_9HEXA|nr:unnamed protein product [Allacma fusca]
MDAGGWFGSSIAKLGDLNQDGYNDFAVGAPNDEDGGSVHIFYGSQNLLDLKKIVIKAKYYNPSFSSFGFSISRGVDIDGNGTPDFSIGSYADKNVVIFRTRPMMKIIHSMYSYINTKAEDPVTLGKDVRQFTIELCATISVVSNNKTLKLSPKNGTVIHAKITIDEMEPGKRFTINGETVTLTQFVFSAAETPLCSQFSLERISIPPSEQLEGQADVTVKYMLWYNETTKASPLISAFQIKNQNNVPEIVASVNSTANFTDFCSNCPYPISTDPELLYITFKKDCRRRNENGTIPVCQPKLSVTITGKFGDCNNFSRSLSGTQNQLILGDTPCLEIYVQVKNSHQVAFSPRIKLHWGWDSSVLALPDLEGKGDLCDIQNNSAICRLDRVRLYLGTNKTQTQDFKLDMQKLDPVDSNPKRLVVDAAVDLESDNEFQPVRSSLAINYKVDANIDLMEGGLSNNSFPVPKDGEILLKEGTLDFYGMAHAKILELMPRANFTRIIINPPDNSGLPGWVILLAVVGGLLFLFLIIFALNKCGFFKRNVKERLEQMKAQTEEDIELDEADAKTPLEGGEDKSKYSTFD